MSDSLTIVDEDDNCDPDGLDGIRIMGAKIKASVRKLDWRLANFDRYMDTAGFAAIVKEHNFSPEQLAAFEDGFKNLTIKK
jgi:hypothetical protein